MIHTVGPVWSGGERGRGRAARPCHRRSLEVAARAGAHRRVPGHLDRRYGFPIERAARIGLATVAEELDARPELERVTFVLFSDDHLRAFEQALAAHTPP